MLPSTRILDFFRQIALIANHAYCLPGNASGMRVLKASHGFYVYRKRFQNYQAKLHVIVYFKGKILKKGEWSKRQTNLVPFELFGSETNPEILVDEEWQRDTLKMWPLLLLRIFKALRTPRGHQDVESIYFIGHAIGGAYATIAAEYFRLFTSVKTEEENYPLFDDLKTRVFTFGAPRIGNEVFAQLINEYSFKDYRFTYGNDHVPHFPRKNIGNQLLVHSETEIWIEASEKCNCVPFPKETKIEEQETPEQAIKYYRCPGTFTLTSPKFTAPRPKERLLFPVNFLLAGENQQCSMSQNFETISDFFFHQGPYFGIKMGDCRHHPVYIE
ncbi:hypothetical protein G9A89_017854 [Geosiphon pyriformis]|nr:hypothetical protein G9A89_017854 [Geosiphon pyriformis]